MQKTMRYRRLAILIGALVIACLVIFAILFSDQGRLFYRLSYYLASRLPGAQSTSQASPQPISLAPEQPVTVIPMRGPAAQANAEISGLAWYNGYLILLLQYPDRFGQGGGALLALSREEILAYLDGEHPGPLQPREIPLVSGGFEAQIRGFEGFEAIDFLGEQVFLTIEAERDGNMNAYVVAGRIAPDLSEIRLDPASLVENKPQINDFNKSDEALLLVGESLLTLFEVNGQARNPEPHATHFDTGLALLGTLPFPNIEYRVTDASSLDQAGRFWVINYQFPGDRDLVPARDPLAEQFGLGATHQEWPIVERLVELQYSPQGITFTGTPPIQLQLLHSGQARNWEGLARLDGRGFLLATDKFPETILAFVPLP